MYFKRTTIKRFLISLGPLLLLLSLLFYTSLPERKPTHAPGSGGSNARVEPKWDTLEFRDSYSKYLRDTPGSPVSGELLELAAKRREQMLAWMERDPERALAEAVSRSEYDALPEELRPFFEKPFNRRASLRVLPVCGAKNATEPVRLLEMDGATWDAAAYGSRAANSTKENSPLAGITLGSRAVIREFALERIAPSETVKTSGFPIANPDPTRDFLTGEPLGSSPVLALAGGQRFLFASPATLDALNAELATYEATPGPNGGSAVLFDAEARDSTGTFSLTRANELVISAASSWTENPKRVFFIRVDFSDFAGETVSQPSLANTLNNSVSDSIREMSYGKTSIIANVSATTVRMPNPSSTYLPSDNDSLYDDAKAAYLALAGSGALDNYDIVGVHFPGIGISSGGFTYAGLAGGSRQWLQGTSNSNVIIHEFGHNYGIGHASFWDTGGTSVIGAGSSSEYGDPFDIMGSGPDPEGHFHIQAKQKLNWLETSQWVDASSSGSGTYRLYRFDDMATTGSVKGLRVTRSASPAEYFWIGQRRGIPNNPSLENGAYIVWQKPDQSRSWLLDLTPGSPAGNNDSALAIGTTWSEGNIHITPTAQGGSGADTWLDVNVRLGPFPGNSQPIITGSLPATAEARRAVNFNLSASDPDADPLAYSWDFGDGAVSTNSPSPQHAWTVGGSYTIKVTVSDMKGGTATLSQSVLVSDPLDTWATPASGTTANLLDIATNGAGRLVAVGSGSGTHRVSTNGDTWSGGTIGINHSLYGICYGASKFVAVGQDYDFSINQWVGIIYTSTDGTSWSQRRRQGGVLNDVAFGNGVFVTVGSGGIILSSPDGITWASHPSGVTRNLDGVAFGAGNFVAVGYQNSIPGVILSSPEGATWTDQSTGTDFGNSQGFYDIEWCSDRFLGSGWYARLRHSTDGGSSFNTNLSDYHRMAAIAYGNGVYFAGGINQSTSNSDIDLISIDGENWQPLGALSVPDRRAAVFYNNTFITVGDGGSIRRSSTFSAPPTSGFWAWRQAAFPTAPPLSGPAEDFDFDGFPNLAEYAMGSNPRDLASPPPLVTTRNGSMLEVVVPKNPTATGVSRVAEWSPDLSNWSAVGVSISGENPNGFTMAIPVSAVPPGRAFMRVAYTLNQ